MNKLTFGKFEWSFPPAHFKGLALIISASLSNKFVNLIILGDAPFLSLDHELRKIQNLLGNLSLLG